jgi:dTMP kinase
MDRINRQKGIFVTFEGPNGVGKSSLLDGVANQLTQVGIDTLRTKEPTLSPLGQFVRRF